jgi:hypothetical protein
LSASAVFQRFVFSETGRYHAPSNLLWQWPMPAGAYEREAGSRAFRRIVERSCSARKWRCSTRWPRDRLFVDICAANGVLPQIRDI